MRSSLIWTLESDQTSVCLWLSLSTQHSSTSSMFKSITGNNTEICSKSSCTNCKVMSRMLFLTLTWFDIDYTSILHTFRTLAFYTAKSCNECQTIFHIIQLPGLTWVVACKMTPVNLLLLFSELSASQRPTATCEDAHESSQANNINVGVKEFLMQNSIKLITTLVVLVTHNLHQPITASAPLLCYQSINEHFSDIFLMLTM